MTIPDWITTSLKVKREEAETVGEGNKGSHKKSQYTLYWLFLILRFLEQAVSPLTKHACSDSGMVEARCFVALTSYQERKCTIFR